MSQRIGGFLVTLLVVLGLAGPAAARNYILRPSPTASSTAVCSRNGLQIVGAVDDGGGAVLLVSAPDTLTPGEVIASASLDPEVVDIEEDVVLSVPELGGATLHQSTTALLDQSTTALLDQSTTALLDALGPRSLVDYYGQPVLNWYLRQPATGLIGLSGAQNGFAADGSGTTVAVIDTGVDPRHPALANSIVPGYDFVHNVAGTASEWADLSQSTTALLDQSTTALLDGTQAVMLNQSTTALLDQSTTALLDTTLVPKAFGHGTMVSGVVHLTAPMAKIMPLKAFSADGNANLSDILQAIYYAADHGANVINMSFSVLTDSAELSNAIRYAATREITLVASTGNTGQPSVSYPAAAAKVIAVASTSNADVRSAFSAYGYPTWVAAPGEAIVTTYPGGHYAAAWGTSFSAPFVSGAAALVVQIEPGASYSGTSKAISKATTLTPDLGYGRLNLLQAVQFAAKY